MLVSVGVRMAWYSSTAGMTDDDLINGDPSVCSKSTTNVDEVVALHKNVVLPTCSVLDEDITWRSTCEIGWSVTCSSTEETGEGGDEKRTSGSLEHRSNWTLEGDPI